MSLNGCQRMPDAPDNKAFTSEHFNGNNGESVQIWSKDVVHTQQDLVCIESYEKMSCNWEKANSPAP